MSVIGKAILKGATLYFVRMDPRKPKLNYNEDGYEWELQVRAPDKKTAEMWESEFHVNVKYDQEDSKSGDIWHGANINRKAYSIEDGKEASFECPEAFIVQDQVARPVDPNTIGNGSIGDVKIQMRTWSNKKKSGTTTDLLGVLVRELVEYTQVADPDWDLSGDTTVTKAEPADDESEGGGKKKKAKEEAPDESAY